MPGFQKGATQSPRFFCESCGAEVPGNAKNCPGCGKRFTSVLCPACGFSGGEALFKNGCPGCGYSPGAPIPRPSRERKTSPESKNPAGALPLWVYLLTAAAFAGIVTALFFTCAG